MAMSQKVKIILEMNKEAKEEWFRTIVKLKTTENAKEFFQDLFSSSEIKDITRRLKCARLLYENKTFQQIEDLIGMGSPTINKIHFKTRGSKILPKLFS